MVSTLTGTDTNTDYFTITSAQLAASTSLKINVATGATVIVNVNGTTDTLTGGMSITGTSISNVLFNFYNATSVSLSSIGFEGSILAPDATFIGKSAVLTAM